MQLLKLTPSRTGYIIVMFRIARNGVAIASAKARSTLIEWKQVKDRIASARFKGNSAIFRSSIYVLQHYE